MPHSDFQEGAVEEPKVVETGSENGEVETTEQDVSSQYPDDEPESDPELDEQDGDEGEFEEGDEEGGEAEEPIAAPVSLKAEEKEQFAQLPREAQQWASEVLGRRDRETQQGLESARLAQQNAERQAADQVAQTKQDFADRFEQFAQAFAPQPPDPRIAQQDPGRYIALKAHYDAEAAQFEQLKGQIAGIRSEAEGHTSQQEQEWRADQIRQLMSVPEFADESTRNEFIASVESFGTSELGYTKEVLANAGAQDIMALKKAMSWKADAEKWRSHMKRRNERPRKSGKFVRSAPGGAKPDGEKQVDPYKVLYPND